VNLDDSTCYRALRSRDPRFDGRFFTAVRTTGIFCRPVCPARTPKRSSCLFVPSAAAAREMGFRPCLRCRPEASPGTPTWVGTSAAVSRALRLIDAGALDAGSIEDLAGRLGLGERHLRRLFQQHLGASPVAVAQTRRVLFAKKLIDETGLSMTEIAFASGFSSIRRFNDAMRKTYARSPRDMRRVRAEQVGTTGLELKLSFRPPLRWDVLVGYLRTRAIPGVESVEGNAYRRTLRLNGHTGRVEVAPVRGTHHLCARLHLAHTGSLIRVVERLRGIFDLDADPLEIGRRLRGDPLLRPVVRRLPGLRVPGAWDGFELAVRAVLGQQVTVKGATTLAGRLVAAHGDRLDDEAAGSSTWPGRLFPTPETLVDADLARIGMPETRADAILGLARAVAEGEIVLDASRDHEETVERLVALPGIGAWTAQYIAMRALGEPDAFPAGDLGLRRGAADGAKLPSARELERRAEAWRPWRAYAAVHLWMKDSLDTRERKLS
jgi:AraC family transcriptional regulator of adaptative response / DNA-3-methyladenine glycosylase II